ncbi:MAG TPA: O-antigen ligase family protein [Candidatus Tumulicola sp.]
MTYHAVVDRFASPEFLDPATAVVFTIVFVAAAYATSRRASYGIVALVVSMPFALARDAFGTTITLPKVALLGVLAGLTVYGSNVFRTLPPPARAILIALLAYLVIVALSTAVAAHPGASIRETLKIAQYALTFLAAYWCARVDADDRPVIVAVAIAALAVSVTALAQEIVGAPSGLFVGKIIVPRIAGVLEGPNQLAGYLQVAVAMLAVWAIPRRSRSIDVALAFATCAGVLTLSRAGLFGLAIVVVIVGAIRGRAGWLAMIPAYLGALAGGAVVCGWAAYAHTANVLRVSLEESAYAGGVGDRHALWQAALRMWRAHPLLGVGAGNYELELPDYGAPGIRTHANSWFLQSLAEGGIALFAATIALLVTILWSFGRRLRAGSPWVVAAFAASSALTVHQFADYLVFYPKVGGAWWVLLGIAAAAALRQPGA